MATRVLDDTALYLGDNGRIYCGGCSGVTAAFTGCDLSGNPVLKVTQAEIDEAKRIGLALRCESCGKGPQS